MNTTVELLVIGASVVAGQWANGKSITAKEVIGLFVLTLFLLLLNDAQPQIGRAFTTLILLVVVFAFWPQILFKLGLNPQQKLSPK